MQKLYLIMSWIAVFRNLVLAQSAQKKLLPRPNLSDQLLKYQPNFELSIVPIIADKNIIQFSIKGHFFRLGKCFMCLRPLSSALE